MSNSQDWYVFLHTIYGCWSEPSRPTANSSLFSTVNVDSTTWADRVPEQAVAEPRGDSPNALEIPASRSANAEAERLMHHLSIVPSMKERRQSRNSFGASLPIPRLRKAAHLRPSMGNRQPSFNTLAAQIQDMSKEKVTQAKNMAFVFDIDGVLVHSLRLIPEGRKALDILNGHNELGLKVRLRET